MTRNQHYVRATQLLKQAEQDAAQSPGWREGNSEKLRLAEIHALLAGVPAKVAGE